MSSNAGVRIPVHRDDPHNLLPQLLDLAPQLRLRRWRRGRWCTDCSQNPSLRWLLCPLYLHEPPAVDLFLNLTLPPWDWFHSRLLQLQVEGAHRRRGTVLVECPCLILTTGGPTVVRHPSFHRMLPPRDPPPWQRMGVEVGPHWQAPLALDVWRLNLRGLIWDQPQSDPRHDSRDGGKVCRNLGAEQNLQLGFPLFYIPCCYFPCPASFVMLLLPCAGFCHLHGL